MDIEVRTGVILRAWVIQASWTLFLGSWSFLPVLVFIEMHLCFQLLSAVLLRIQGQPARASEEVGEGTVMQLLALFPRIPPL